MWGVCGGYCQPSISVPHRVVISREVIMQPEGHFQKRDKMINEDLKGDPRRL